MLRHLPRNLVSLLHFSFELPFVVSSATSHDAIDQTSTNRWICLIAVKISIISVPWKPNSGRYAMMQVNGLNSISNCSLRNCDERESSSESSICKIRSRRWHEINKMWNRAKKALFTELNVPSTDHEIVWCKKLDFQRFAIRRGWCNENLIK